MQRLVVSGLLLAGVGVSGALGGHLIREGGGARRPATAVRPCVAEAPMKVASEASPIVGSQAACDALMKDGD